MNRNLRIAAIESRYEIVKLARTTAFIVPTLSFPVLFYLFFGVAFGGNSVGPGMKMGVYLIATYGAFGVIGAALSSFGAAIAIERGQGWLQMKHATPMPLSAYLVAKLVAAMLFGTIIVLALFVAGATVGGASMPFQQWLTLLAVLVAGTIPFALLGLTLGYLVSAQAVIAVINLIYLPMGFLSGLWVPVDFLPGAVQRAAEFLPAFHLGQLALGVIGAPTHGTAGGHVAALAGFTLIFLATAIFAYRHDRRRNYA
jgi:ABC-2 type transport system permease protein